MSSVSSLRTCAPSLKTKKTLKVFIKDIYKKLKCYSFYIAFQLLIKGTALHQQTFKVVLKAAACLYLYSPEFISTAQR